MNLSLSKQEVEVLRQHLYKDFQWGIEGSFGDGEKLFEEEVSAANNILSKLNKLAKWKTEISSEEVQQKLGFIKFKFKKGELSYDEAKEKAQPLFDILDERAEKVAQKYHRKYHKIGFSRYMR
jgi:hypothetical protein